jgi:signal transduction histidine kinase
MSIFRPCHIRTSLISLFPTITGGTGPRAITAFAMVPLSIAAPEKSTGTSHTLYDYFGLVQLDKEQLYNGLLVIIFLFLLVILYALWLHNQRRKLKAMNITLSEQRSEQELLLAENQKKQREMSRLNQVQNRILSIIGHDLRGPLSSMYEIFRAYATGDMKIEEEEMEAFMKECYHQMGSIYFLAENLLFWAKNQNDGFDSFPGDYSLHIMGKEAIGLLQQGAYAKEIKIQLDINEDARVFCDYNQISSVLRNLLSNAIKFTDRGGVIVMSNRAIKDEQIITISDNGIGMEQDKLDLMLKQRLSYTTKGTDNETGTGLGISLIAEFVEKNGGKLIGSSRPGHGTSFSFSLPAAHPDNHLVEDHNPGA